RAERAAHQRWIGAEVARGVRVMNWRSLMQGTDTPIAIPVPSKDVVPALPREAADALDLLVFCCRAVEPDLTPREITDIILENSAEPDEHRDAEARRGNK